MQLCPSFGVCPYVKKYLFPMSAVAALAMTACKPAPPPPPSALATPPPAPSVAAATAPGAEKPPRPEAAPGGGPGGDGPRGGGSRGDFAQRAQERLDRLKTDLALTDDQVEKIKTIFAQQVTSMQSLRGDESLDREQRMARMKEAREAVDAQVAAILTPEQKSKWDEVRKQREAEMAERRANRQKDGGAPPPPPPAQ
jgi:hypothetical protein